MKMTKGLENLLCGVTEGVRTVSLEKIQRGPHHSTPVLKGRLKGGQTLCLHKN